MKEVGHLPGLTATDRSRGVGTVPHVTASAFSIGSSGTKPGNVLLPANTRRPRKTTNSSGDGKEYRLFYV